MSIEPIVFINRGGKPKTSSVKGGNWLLSCDQHVGSCFKEENFEDGKLSQQNIMHPSMKSTKSAGTTNKDTVAMAAKKDRPFLARLGKSGDESKNAPKPTNRRTTSGKTDVPCTMHIRIFLSRADDYFYLSKSSDMTHIGHIEVPNACIPQNESSLTEEDRSMVNSMFACDISASHISRLISERNNTYLKAKTILNMRVKAMNVIDSSIGITTDMNDADKTLKKLQE